MASKTLASDRRTKAGLDGRRAINTDRVVENAIAPTQYSPGCCVIGEPDARHRFDRLTFPEGAAIGTSSKAKAAQNFKVIRRKTGHWVSRIVRSGSRADRVGGGIVKAHHSTVVTLGYGCFMLKPDTKIHRQFRGSPPVVLEIGAVPQVLIGITAVRRYRPSGPRYAQ